MLERRFQTVITQNLCTFDALRMREVLTPSESEPHSNIVVVIDPNLPVNLVFPWGGGLGVLGCFVITVHTGGSTSRATAASELVIIPV